ncbi:uncharacterized protein V1516DRAFT_682358 [Lipomyces oligophaga]|uniref:uncharacterized protein n=1 Tax=Lipomyces oligophaga TaxID=45792 RepID=UPI0034CFD1A8
MQIISNGSRAATYYSAVLSEAPRNFVYVVIVLLYRSTNMYRYVKDTRSDRPSRSLCKSVVSVATSANMLVCTSYANFFLVYLILCFPAAQAEVPLFSKEAHAWS